MKLTKVSLCLATLALGVASAASSYSITLPADTWAGDTQLKAGEYKLQVETNQVTFSQGKTSVPVAVTVETKASKTPYTMLDTENSKLRAIDIGGTKLKIVFVPVKPAAASSAAQ
jgi:hexokinase